MSLGHIFSSSFCLSHDMAIMAKSIQKKSFLYPAWGMAKRIILRTWKSDIVPEVKKWLLEMFNLICLEKGNIVYSSKDEVTYSTLAEMLCYFLITFYSMVYSVIIGKFNISGGFFSLSLFFIFLFFASFFCNLRIVLFIFFF